MPSLDPPILDPTLKVSIAPMPPPDGAFPSRASVVSCPRAAGPRSSRFGGGVSGRVLDGLLHAAALDEVEPADHLLGLGKRTVGDKRLPVADADGTEAGFGPASVQVVPMCQIWRRRSVWIQTTSRSASCASRLVSRTSPSRTSVSAVAGGCL